jgi:hypothetical protein
MRRSRRWVTLLLALGGGVAAKCPHDNLLRCFIRTPDLAITFCSWTAGIYPTASTIYETTTLYPDEPPAATTTRATTLTRDTYVTAASTSSSAGMLTGD